MERAYITQILDPYHVVVRIPTLNKYDKASGATPDSELATAIVAAPSGTHVEFSVGDAVLVEFEAEDYSKPVVVGSLFNQKTKNQQNVFEVNKLKVGSTAELPIDTVVGEVSKESIQLLKGLELDPAETLQDRLTETASTLVEHRGLIDANKQSIDATNKSLADTSTAVSNYTKELCGGTLDVALKVNTATGHVTIGGVSLTEHESSTTSDIVTPPPYTLNGLANSMKLVIEEVVKSMNNTVTYVDGVKQEVQNHSHTVSSIKDILVKSDADLGENVSADTLNSNPKLTSTPNGAILFVYKTKS